LVIILKMNIIWACLLLVGGLIILWKCAGLLVSGAVGLARRLGVSPLVVGLTVVAMGTSAPELAASIAAALRNAGDIAIGNVYGSNIANLALVGGLCAIIRPITVQMRTLRREMPVMLAVALLLWPVLHNLYLSRPEALVLLGVFIALILLTVYLARKEATGSSSDKRNTQACPEHSRRDSIRDTKKNVLFIVIGLAGLALSADLAVRGAIVIGERIGLSQAVIGLTIIAVGTSLPELATSLVASIRGQHDISIGNLVGSNIFNTLLVVGTAGLVRPFSIGDRLIGLDYYIMLIVSVVFLVMAAIGRRISRANGIILFLGYFAYIAYLLSCSP